MAAGLGRPSAVGGKKAAGLLGSVKWTGCVHLAFITQLQGWLTELQGRGRGRGRPSAGFLLSAPLGALAWFFSDWCSPHSSQVYTLQAWPWGETLSTTHLAVVPHRWETWNDYSISYGQAWWWSQNTQGSQGPTQWWWENSHRKDI